MDANSPKIGILAGGGRLPLMIAESVTAHGGTVHIVGIEGEADAGIARFPHTWVNWGEIGRMVAVLHRDGGRELVIAGSVRRPDLKKLRPDIGFFLSLPRIVGLMAGGDDSVLSRVVRFFEGKGLVVRGAHEVAPDLLAAPGRVGKVPMPEPAHRDAEIGFAVRGALGPLDAGQAVVVADGEVLAIEGAEGTDAMLERAARRRAGRSGAARSGVLSKGPKPGQELRIDMPAIGPRTVELAAAAGLAGVAVEAGGVLMLDRAETVAVADRLGLAIEGFAGTGGAADHMADAALRSGRVAGRRRPSRRDARDLAKGLAVVARLKPFGTGGAVTVARAYILAIETGEGIAAFLGRIAVLRQWGLDGGRRVGVLVCRGEALAEAGIERMLAEAAREGLAGVAVAGPRAALAPCEDQAAHADTLGLFLVLCETA